MLDLDRYRIRIVHEGLHGLSGSGFRSVKTSPADVFPTADEIDLSMRGYYQKLGECASIIYEVPRLRYGVVDHNGVLEMAVQSPSGDYIGVITDVLAFDIEEARTMLDDIEQTCGFVRAKHSEAMGIMEIPKREYLARLRDSIAFLAAELRR